MNELKEKIEERISKLNKIIQEKKRALQKAPDGVLNVHEHDKSVQFYFKESSGDKVRKYVNANNKFLVQGLCQKDYDQRVLKAAENEMKALEKVYRIYQNQTCEEIFDKLHKQRKIYVTPIMLPDDMFIQNWQQEYYEGKGFAPGFPEYYTDKGERVRSKSEVIIANILNKYGIPYKYEKPLFLGDYVTMYPDFTTLNVRERKEKYFEHFGMMDDPQYAETAINKIETYAKNEIFVGDNLIPTFESRNKPLNQKIVEAIIKKYLL